MEELIHIPTIQETVQDILTGTTEEEASHAGFSTTALCFPLIDSNQDIGSTKEFPAQDCEQIRHVRLKAESGTYWVDPNMGCSSDAIQVFCNFSSNSTCIFPQQNKVRMNDQLVSLVKC